LEKMRIQEKRREKTLSMLFHDFNNKLVYASGVMQLMEEGEFSSFHFTSLKKNINSLHTLSNEFQSIALNNEDIPVSISEVDTCKLIEEVVQAYSPTIHNKKHNLTIELVENVIMKTDYMGMKRVIDRVFSLLFS